MNNMHFTLVAVLACITLPAKVACHSTSSHSDCPQVDTTSGLIIGHRAPNVSNTFEFLGIRYGQAPIGDLRFASPRPYTVAEGTVYNASNWNPDCPATIPPVTKFPNFTGNGFEVYNEFTAHLGNTQDEDCLALNVWSRMSRNRATAKPVFIFFHGGRFAIPGPHSPFYNGKYFADREDVVVVTISYRLGIFGFSGAPGVNQNAALLDQRLAVEWVRKNIAGFGGDVDRIIIFGQSAGSASVDYYAYAWKDDPIAAGLISHSGTAFSFIPNTPEYSRSLFYNASGTLGCGNSTTSNPATVLSCVRSKNLTEVLAAARIAPALPSVALAQPAFHPTVDNITVFADYTELAKCGSFAKIPYLAGNANYEAGFYRVGAFSANVTLQPQGWDLFNQRAFTCPTKYATDARANNRVPVWRYRYMADWENLRLYGSWGGYPDSGAYHGSDMGMIFGTAQDISGQRNSRPENQTSRYIMEAWAAFGRHPKRGLTDFGWPSYGENSTVSLVRLAYENHARPNFVEPELYDAVCPAVEQNDPLPGQGAF